MKRAHLFAAIGAILCLVVSCQKTPTAEVSISQNELTASAMGGNISVNVSSNVDLTVRISVPWITQTGAPSGGGGLYSFNVERNSSYDPRTATITFSNGEQGVSETVNVIQSQQDAIIPGKLEYELFYEAQTFTLPISANVDYTVSLDGGDWIKSLGTRGLSSKQYQFSIAENTGKTTREAVLNISSERMKQSIKIVQLPTTHRPVTKEEWKESINLTETITKEKVEIISQLKKAGISNINTIANKLHEIEGVIEAIPNRDGTIISIMQKDSIWLDIFLYNPNTRSSFNSGNSRRNTSSITTRSTSSSGGDGSGKRKALILAPFQRDFQEPITEEFKVDEWDQTWSDMLNPFFKVDPLMDSDADIYHFTDKYLSDGYDFIIITTHGGEVTYVEDRLFGGTKETTINTLLSGTKYSEDIVTDLVKNGYTYYIRLGSPAESEEEYLEMNPSFLLKASFDDTVVLINACSSAQPRDMVDTFRKKGASYVVGTEAPVDNTAQIVFTQNILSCLSNGMTFKDAFHYSSKSELAKQWSQRVINTFEKVPGFTEDDKASLDLYNSLSIFPEKSDFDYYFKSPYPSINIDKSKGNVLVWECNLNPFKVFSATVEKAYLYDVGDGDMRIAADWNRNISYVYSIKYYVYVDGKIQGETTSKSYSLNGISTGKHNAYVVANIVAGQGNNVLYSYKSKEEKINVTGETVAVTGVKIRPSTVSIEPGETYQLTATVMPDNASNKDVEWKSNHPELVSVDENGLITAIKRQAGTTVYITAKTVDGGKSSTCQVTVKEPSGGEVAVTGISLNQTSAELEVGKTLQLKSTITPSNATNKSVQWTSSNSAVASVDINGLVTAKAIGTAKITAKTEDGGKTATVSITVKKASEQNVPVTGVSINMSSLSLKVGESATLTTTIAPANATNKGVTWTTSMSSVATVTSDGVVTAKAAGTAVITAKTEDGGKTATCNVTVTYTPDPGGEVSVTQVTISPTSVNMTVGDTKQFSVKIDPANATNQEVSWSSSDPSVASIDSKGLVTAKAEGKATITVTANDGGVSSKATVTVNNKTIPVTGVSVSPASLSMEIGESKALSVTVSPSDATDKTYTVTSDNTGVVDIDNGNNIVAKGAGTANVLITTSDGGFTAKCVVTVNKPQMTISVEPSSLAFGDVNVGESSTKTFSISNTGKAEVKVSGISVPEAYSVDVTTPFTIAVGQSKTVTVTFTPTDGKDYNGSITITSDADSQPTVAVSGKGIKQSSSETFEAVDLGLSVKWANMNLGATKPEEYGDYYAWGETEQKNNYDFDTYKWSKDEKGTVSLIKYCLNYLDGYDGFTDGKSILDLDDDAAYSKLKGKWRLPTATERDELYTKCSFELATINGIKGCVVIGPNGNSIFLPAAGYVSGVNHKDVGEECYSWTSALYSDLSYSSSLYSKVLRISVYKGYPQLDATEESRDYGLPIRPVYGDLILSVENVSLDKTELKLSVGENASLVASVIPSNAINTSVSWASNNESVAKVSSSGIVTALSPGSATITVTTSSGGKKATCSVTVIDNSSSEATAGAVDLGLSVKWASCNLGASTPEEIGDFYAWGETATKEEYSWDNYKWFKDEFTDEGYIKYCLDESYGYLGFKDGKAVLDPEDDAAHVILGNKWRMPTKEELEELRTKCTSTVTSINGQYGRLFTSTVNQNSIFLPFTGYKFGSAYTDLHQGRYWSSSIFYEDAYHMYIVSSSSASSVSITYGERRDGMVIRPVMDK